MFKASNLFGKKEKSEKILIVEDSNKATTVYKSTQLIMISYLRKNAVSNFDLLAGCTLSTLYFVAKKIGTHTEDIPDLLEIHGVKKTSKNILSPRDMVELFNKWHSELEYHLSTAEANYFAAELLNMIIYSMDANEGYSQSRVGFEELRHYLIFDNAINFLNKSHYEPTEVHFDRWRPNDITYLRNLKYINGQYQLS